MEFIFGLILFVVGIIWTRSQLLKFRKNKMAFTFDNVMEMIVSHFANIGWAIAALLIGFSTMIYSITNG